MRRKRGSLIYPNVFVLRNRYSDHGFYTLRNGKNTVVISISANNYYEDAAIASVRIDRNENGQLVQYETN